MLALTVVFYNYRHAHKSLGGKTPEMVAGLTDTDGRLPTCSDWTCGARRRLP
jgi:hypothetical protein